MEAATDTFRNRFHLSPRRGWMNDPNGFSHFGGTYHLFYQHHPDDTVWGPMHWGHATSADLLNWTHQPVALSPGDAFDTEGCFSGSAVSAQGRHALIYTGHVDPQPGTAGSKHETQCLAWGDGVVYTKDSANPVLGADQLPAGASREDFRDPKVWREGDRWLCLVANGQTDGKGQLLLFESTNLRNWQFVTVCLANDGALGALGTMWECPDFFRVGDQEVLLWSLTAAAETNPAFQNLCGAVWAPGSLKPTGQFVADAWQEVDRGPDFYAPQVVKAPDGRLILIAWMQMWHRSFPTRELGLDWAGCMTLPREVTIKKGALCQYPLKELDNYHGKEIRLDSCVEGRVSFPRLEGQHIDLKLTFAGGTATRCGLLLYVGEGEETKLEWDRAAGMVTLDRRGSGYPIRDLSPHALPCQVFTAAVGLCDSLKIRLVLDRSALEVFLQDGQWTMAATLFPKPDSRGIHLYAEEGCVKVGGRAWPLV